MLKNNKALGQHWLKNRAILNEIARLAAEGMRGAVAEGTRDVAAEGVRDVAAEGTCDVAATRGAAGLATEGCAGGIVEGSAGGIAEKTDKNSEKKNLCLEIGPGLGTLTSSLFRYFKGVLAVEFDARLAENLPGSFPGKELEVVNADFLKFDLEAIKAPYVVAGNIPYYITSPIIEKLLKAERAPERIVLLIQKEVAERIASKKQTMLSLMVQNRAKVELGPVVLREEFTPPPKVDSQVIVLTPHAPILEEEVFDLIRRGFAAPRKKLVHNLSGLKSKEELERILTEIGVDANARAGDLQLKDWARLKKML